MEKILYTTEDCWGNTYLFKKGYKRVTSNIDKIETNGGDSDDWVARYCWTDEDGNVYLNYKEGRKLKIELNPRLDLYADDYMILIREEIEKMEDTKKEIQTVYSELEKMVSKRT